MNEHPDVSINPLFNCTQNTNEAGQADCPFYWTGTTHANSTSESGGNAVYINCRCAMAYMNEWLDVHGAGVQRSDPKLGDPDEYPAGCGPHGDAIRIFNCVRCVGDINKRNIQK